MPRHVRRRMPVHRRFIAVITAFAVVCTIGSVTVGQRLAGIHNEQAAASAHCRKAADALTDDLTTLRTTLSASRQFVQADPSANEGNVGNGSTSTAENTATGNALTGSNALSTAQKQAESTLSQTMPQCDGRTDAGKLTDLANMLTAQAGDVRSQARSLAASSVSAANALNADGRATLATASSQGQWWLASTDGHVDDERTRDELSAAIDRADALLDDTNVHVDGEPYRQATAALNTAMDAVAASNVAALGVDCAKSPCVALTFDDGPSSKTTPAVIDVLQRTNTTATFFTVGEHVANGDEGKLTKELADKGYPIENHSWNHADLASLNAGDLASQLRDTNRVIKRTVGYEPTMIRPPYSSWSDAVRQEAIRRNAAIINYDTIGVDWSVGADQVYDKVVRWTHSGSIILLHDIQPGTAQSIERIITTLKARGFIFVSIPQLLGGRPQPGWVYYSRTGHITPDQPWADSSQFTAQW